MKTTFKKFLLTEIILMAAQPTSSLAVYVSSIKDEKPFGRFENFMVYQGTIDTKIALVARTDDEAKSFIGYAIGNYQIIDSKKYWCSEYTFFDSKFRGKGFATGLIQFILTKLNVPIISDQWQTSDGRKLWKSLMQKNKHHVYDRYDKKILDLTDVPDDKLYSTDDQIGGRYALVIEEAHESFKRGGPSVILHEYVRFTNPEKDYY